MAAGAGLTIAVVALAGGDDGAPVAASPSTTADVTASPEPSPTPTSTPIPTTPAEPEPTPEPEASGAPALVACGTAAPQVDEVAAPWVGDYGGGIDGDVALPVDLRWSVITGEDWGGRTMTASVVDLWLVSEDGTVVAVPASEPPDTVPLAMSEGSEGGGGGSEGVIELTTTFVACPDGSGGLAPAAYRARVGILIDGATAQPVWGDIVVFVPDYDTATAA